MLTPLSLYRSQWSPRDSTASTIIDTSATSNPTAKSETDMTDCVVVQQPVVDTQDEGASPLEGMMAKDEEHKKAWLVEWASSLTLKDVVLTKEGIDVETLGVSNWSDPKCYVKQAFLQTNKVAIAQAHRKNNDLGKNVANERN